MSRRSRVGRFAAALALAATLGGCVSLLPKAPPVQLYRFGQMQVPAATGAAVVGRGESSLGVILSEVVLPRAALGDGILTVTGQRAAYIAGARWLEPAVLMFREATQAAFEGRARRVRLIDRGEAAAASALLRLDVTEFDLRYAPQGGQPPTVVVRLRATLTRADGVKLIERSFAVERPAAENRMGAIASGFDSAVADVLVQVVDWTSAETPALAADLPADAPTQAPLPHVRPIGPR